MKKIVLLSIVFVSFSCYAQNNNKTMIQTIRQEAWIQGLSNTTDTVGIPVEVVDFKHPQPNVHQISVIPETKVLPILDAKKKSHNEEVKSTLLELNADLQQNLITLEGYCTSMSRLNQEIALLIKENHKNSMSILERIRAHVNSPSDLIADTKTMQEMQMSFNLQYLELQQQMQDENRRFTMISNIMKTKHDTAKNSINNIR